MTIFSVIGQKGGNGKSTLCRALATEFKKNGWDVQIADMDNKQNTARNWNLRRAEAGHTPELDVACYDTPKQVKAAANSYDLSIVDGSPYATKATFELAQISDMVLLPVKSSVDDLQPQLDLAQELRRKGVAAEKLLFVIGQVPQGGDKGAMETKTTIKEWGFPVVDSWTTLKESYAKAMDGGRSIIEASHPSLREKADRQIQQIVDHFTQLQAAEVA